MSEELKAVAPVRKCRCGKHELQGEQPWVDEYDAAGNLIFGRWGPRLHTIKACAKYLKAELRVPSQAPGFPRIAIDLEVVWKGGAFNTFRSTLPNPEAN